MKESLSNTPAFPNFVISPEVYMAQDDEAIFAIIKNHLITSGLDQRGLIYTGIDGSDIPRQGFSGRTGTFGMTWLRVMDALRDGDRRSPLEYAWESEVPMIAVFDATRLVIDNPNISEDGTYLDFDNPRVDNFEQFRTPDGSSLDTVVVATFTFSP